jgi:hypothetical protein
LDVTNFHANLTLSRLIQGRETGRKQGMQVLTNTQTIEKEFVVGKINEDETEFMVLEENEENKIINLLN